ncbi:MAG TPA: hypothetical protein VG711_06770, partial [Phycisphaerales bacterium]|nr:hypothetical protein [Phycisphaerales bacterium]
MSVELKPTEDGRRESPLAEVWRIAWPTVLAMTSYTIMNFMDGLMVAQLGSTQLGAQNIGVMWSFSLTAIALGVLSVV